MRVAVKLGAVDEYELAAVAAHGLRSGRRRQHEHSELRLPLVGAGGREDGRLIRPACPPPDPLLPRVRAAGDAPRDRQGRSRERATPRPAGRDGDHPRPPPAGEPVRVRDREAAAAGRPAALDAGRRRRPSTGSGCRRPPLRKRRVSLERHQQDWERLAEVDALWAVLTDPAAKAAAGVSRSSSRRARRRSHTFSTSPRGSSRPRSASGRSTSAAASAGSRARSPRRFEWRSGSTSRPGWWNRLNA